MNKSNFLFPIKSVRILGAIFMKIIWPWKLRKLLQLKVFFQKWFTKNFENLIRAALKNQLVDRRSVAATHILQNFLFLVVWEGVGNRMHFMFDWNISIYKTLWVFEKHVEKEGKKQCSLCDKQQSTNGQKQTVTCLLSHFSLAWKPSSEKRNFEAQKKTFLRWRRGNSFTGREKIQHEVRRFDEIWVLFLICCFKNEFIFFERESKLKQSLPKAHKINSFFLCV